MAIDYGKEAEALIEGRNWWKPKAGQHKVTFLSDGEEYESKFDDKIIPKVRFDIKVGNDEFSWGVVKGKTSNSLYGQIVILGKHYGGSMIQKTITLLAKGSGKEMDYTIAEALTIPDLNKEEVVGN